jgi:cobyrinic acid a,c-diamide synthase
MTGETGPSGLMIAAPSSGSGKTIFTLGLLRALLRRGLDVAGAKAGPDYIDPVFHQSACGKPSVNLDPWAMRLERLEALAKGQGSALLVVEAMMGLFDGAADGSGSAADLAQLLGMPVVLVVDAGRQSHSIAAVVRGFRDHRREIDIAGVILNRIGSARHEAMLRSALSAIGMPVVGAIPRLDVLGLPERHLGLVQANEQSGLEELLEASADIVERHGDVDAVLRRFKPLCISARKVSGLPPPGNRIAIARDQAFSFIYPHMVDDWRNSGAEIMFFSPLGDEVPDSKADAIFLPGGYPELHVARIAAATNFKKAMEGAAATGVAILGECGGYMVLGDGIEDANGQRHEMCGLLRLETSFARKRLHLGYRKLEAINSGFALGDRFTAHEFHYTTAVREDGQPLFSVWDGEGNALGQAGLRSGSVMGSYMHIIDGDG